MLDAIAELETPALGIELLDATALDPLPLPCAPSGAIVLDDGTIGMLDAIVLDDGTTGTIVETTTVPLVKTVGIKAMLLLLLLLAATSQSPYPG